MSIDYIKLMCGQMVRLIPRVSVSHCKSCCIAVCNFSACACVRPQEQHARLSKAPRQTEEEERGAGVRLSVQLALCSRPGRPHQTAQAEVGLRETLSLTDV